MYLDYGISMRPTRQRLHTAMGISTCAVAALLALVGLIVDVSLAPLAERGELLKVLISNVTDEPATDISTDEAAEESSPIPTLAPAEFMERQYTITPVYPPEPVVEPKPVRDWYQLADLAARATVDEHIQQEGIRASMWRQTHSEMFRPSEESLLLEEEPILSDLRFIPRIHVVGLGVTIGSCFIGIPLIGVPVEQRSAAISVFVCAGDAG